MVQGHGLQATGRPEPAQVCQLLARAAVLVGSQGDLDNVVVVIVPETQAIEQEAHCARAGRERDSNRGVRGRRWGMWRSCSPDPANVLAKGTIGLAACCCCAISGSSTLGSEAVSSLRRRVVTLLRDCGPAPAALSAATA